MEYKGEERRHSIQDCPQEKRFERIEMIMDGLVKQLASSNETLVAIRELLNGKIEKYDGHVQSGEKWRDWIFQMFITTCIAGFSTILGIGIWVGSMQSDVHRLQALHPYGTQISDIK